MGILQEMSSNEILIFFKVPKPFTCDSSIQIKVLEPCYLAAKCEHVGESIPTIEKNGFHHCITTILSYSYVFVGFFRSLEPKFLHTHKCSSTSTTLFYEWRMATKRPDLSPQSKRTRWPPM